MVQRVAVLLSLLVLVFAGIAASAGAAPGPALTVDASADRQPISPGIYGMNGADPALATELRLPVDRWGGNDRERYNWKLATKSTAVDWYYENIPDCVSDGVTCAPAATTTTATPAVTAQGSYLPMIARDKAAGGTTVMQLPLIGWVPKDRKTNHPFTCGFPWSQHPLQRDFDRWEPATLPDRCGDGVTPGGALIAPGPPTQTSKPFGPADAKEWVQDLVARYGDAAHGGVGYYELGNEPALWDRSHRDVHPDPTTFDELRDKSVAMATAIKEADPTAKVIGLSEWGWTNYFCSAFDQTDGDGFWGCQPTDRDRAAHEGAELSAWYLAQMKTASDTAGTRLLDDFDLHYYAQAGGYGLDASRALWDPTYTDPTWVNSVVRLLPRMRDWVDQNFAGTGISLSEYNLTDLSDAQRDTVVGTLSEADALGIFAREGVDMAAMWNPPKQHERVADAFRLYRDYDGRGSRFGDTWIRSVSEDQGQLAVYGAQRGADGALTIAVLNKTADSLEAPLRISGAQTDRPIRVWRWTDRGIARQPDTALTAATTAFPPLSMTLLVVPGTGTVDPPDDGGGGADPPARTITTPTPTVTTPPPPRTTPVPPPGPGPVVLAPLARVTTTKATLRGRTIALRVACPVSKTGCGGTVALRAGKTTLGTYRKLSLRGGRTTTVKLTLSRSRAKTVARYGRRGRPVKATITLGKRVATTALRLRGR